MNNQTSKILSAAALAGAFAVGIGAFGAHGLKPHLSDFQATIFEKGVEYHFVHTVAMLVAGFFFYFDKNQNAAFRQAAWLFFGGIICFSGSLYLLACRDLLPFGVGLVGPITPIGGILFLAGWLRMFWGFWKM